MQCVILAGGLGKRMQSAHPKLPKSLISVKNYPFLHYQLSQLAGQEIRKVILCVGYGADQIMRYVEDGRSWGMNIQYIHDDFEQPGSGGALRLALDQNQLEPSFFVLSGDAYLTTDMSALQDFFDTRTEPALSVVSKVKDSSAGHVMINGQKITQYDKSHPSPDLRYLDSGLSLLRPTAIGQGIPPKSPYAIEDLFHKLSQTGRLAGIEIQTRAFNIGTPDGLQEFSDAITESTWNKKDDDSPLHRK
jgi:NDP-sugar pyrophosphorylase family protein